MRSSNLLDDGTSSLPAPPPEEFTGTDGKDKFRGASGVDFFDMRQGGNDVVHGAAGDDSVSFGAAFSARDKIDGGSGLDELDLNGDYADGIVFRDNTMVNIESLQLYGTSRGGGDYKLILSDNNASGYLRVFLQAISGDNNALWFDASAESSADIAVSNSSNTGINNIWTGGGNDSISTGHIDTGQTFDGGAGYDIINFGRSGIAVTFSLAHQGQGLVLAEGHLVTVEGFEAVIGSFNGDILTGDDRDNYMRSNGGSDTIQAAGGDDFVVADDLYTTLHLDGGSGSNTLSFQFSFEAGVTFSLAAQGSAQVTSQGEVTATGFANLEGTNAFDDHLTGDGTANQILGGGGTDTLHGDDGNDQLYGDGYYIKHWTDAGSQGFDGAFDVTQDPEFGGNDVLDGGAGNDRLTGGVGADSLTGGSGADKFVYGIVADSGMGAVNRDVIADFNHAELDRIDLHAIDADSGAKGDQAFHLGGASFTHSAGELIQFSDGQGHTIVSGDTNGDGQAEFEIQINNAPVLVAGDFLL